MPQPPERGRLVAQRGMRSHAIVVLAPSLDHDLRFLECREDLAVQQLVAQPPVETFHIAVLPRTAALDVGGPCADRTDPALHGLELRSLIRADVGRHTAQQEQIGQRLDHVHRVQPARNLDCQALACVFVARHAPDEVPISIALVLAARGHKAAPTRSIVGYENGKFQGTGEEAVKLQKKINIVIVGLVEPRGIEPLTSAVRLQRSPI
jgi:hypothetical protein